MREVVYSSLQYSYDNLPIGNVDEQIILLCKNGNIGGLDLQMLLQQYKSAKHANNTQAISVLTETLNNIDQNILKELEDSYEL